MSVARPPHSGWIFRYPSVGFAPVELNEPQRALYT